MPVPILNSTLKRWAFRRLAQIEQHLFIDCQTPYCPTFIVGPPRAGTTLLRQLVAWAIPTSYFSNLTGASVRLLGYPLPGTTAWLARWLPGIRFVRSFKSVYGHTRGATAPTEGEFIWGYLFDNKRSAVDPNELTSKQQRAIYGAVAATERAFGLPFVNKTSVLSLRIRALVKVFPDALFIQVRRDPLDVVQSIFRARQTNYPDWLGPKPTQCENVGDKSILEQVCEQVYYVEENIADERSVVGEDRFLTVTYKDVCDNPLIQLKRVAAFMSDHGAPARITQAVPHSFEFSHGRRVEAADYRAMRAHLDKLAATAHQGVPET